jgi:hypothetical protein
VLSRILHGTRAPLSLRTPHVAQKQTKDRAITYQFLLARGQRGNLAELVSSSDEEYRANLSPVGSVVRQPVIAELPANSLRV